MVIVVILPLTQFLIDQMDIIEDAVSVEKVLELLVTHAMRSLDLAV